MRLDKFYNLSVFRTDLGMGLDVKPIYKFVNFVIKTNSKIYKSKAYNEGINNLIHRND